jgi:GAF domain-containing protein
MVSYRGIAPVLLKALKLQANRLGRALLERKIVHVLDALVDPEYTFPTALAGVAGSRTLLGVPLLREGSPIGVMTLGRKSVRPLTDKQIELAETFADQAAIAIENARLLKELRQRTARDRQDLPQVTGHLGRLRVDCCAFTKAESFRIDQIL